jgi:hypothetical protein
MSSQQIYADQELFLKSRSHIIETGQYSQTSTSTINFSLPNLADFKANNRRILTCADMCNVAPTVEVGSTTTLQEGSNATVQNVGTNINAILNFGIPRGNSGTNGTNGMNGSNGAPGAAGTVTIESTSTLAPGSQATVLNVGTQNAALLRFGIPAGANGTNGTNGTNGINGTNGTNGTDGTNGLAATIGIGTTTTLSPGSSATVSNTGSVNAAILNFGIPAGIGLTDNVQNQNLSNSPISLDAGAASITSATLKGVAWNAPYVYPITYSRLNNLIFVNLPQFIIQTKTGPNPAVISLGFIINSSLRPIRGKQFPINITNSNALSKYPAQLSIATNGNISLLTGNSGPGQNDTNLVTSFGIPFDSMFVYDLTAT